jgi:hypothetical protein
MTWPVSPTAFARPEVEHGFTFVEIRQGGGVAAPERCEDRTLRKHCGLACLVEIRADGIASAVAIPTSTAAPAFAGQHVERRPRIVLLHRFLDSLAAHVGSSINKS